MVPWKTTTSDKSVNFEAIGPIWPGFAVSHSWPAGQLYCPAEGVSDVGM